MQNYYTKKAEFHYTEWQIAMDNNKEKAAAHHMREYLNYKEMYDTKPLLFNGFFMCYNVANFINNYFS